MSYTLDRRTFIKATGIASVAPPALGRAAAPTAASETLVASLYKSLKPEQKKVVTFPFEHPLRSKVDNNWKITKPIAEVFDADQKAMIKDIFRGVHSAEYVERVFKATAHDQEEEGFDGGCSVALFGTPGTGKFEFVLSGRHVTRRCDGDSVEGVAFGGPMFYGHQAGLNDREKPDHPGNVYWYQAVRAHQMFQALDGKQRALALLDEPRRENGSETVKLTGKTRGLPGIPASLLHRDQKDLLRKVMTDLLAPFRERDAAEAMKLVEKQGVDNLHLAFYKNDDLGGDGVWDVWQVEGPEMVWFFRGAPHVHVWVHVRQSG